MTTATFYHAGCPVCLSAEQEILSLIDNSKVAVEVVHLGEAPNRIAEAEQAGLQSVPALLLENGQVLHINFGASIADVKQSVSVES